MKKLMIAAAVAAMTAGAFASPCVDEEEEMASCYAWDVKMSLKSLGPKKTTCKTVEEVGPCEDDEVTKADVYYMDNVTRKVTGYFYQCEYSCDTLSVVLWDSKNKVGLALLGSEADASKLVVYGKKATKVAGAIEIETDDLVLTAAGVNGKMVRGVADDDCYVKSLSGYAAGSIAYVKPGYTVTTVTAGALCEDDVIVVDECEDLAKLLPFCEACCFTDWCEADDWEDLVPAVGTWSMKYNKRVAAGKKGSITQLVPAYAL